MPSELAYLGVLFALFVVPKVLQRFRLPAAVTSLVLGGAASAAGLFRNDPTIHLLATFGIVALFLFAGLELDAADFRGGSRVLAQHLAIQVGSLVFVALVVSPALGLGPRAAWLVALAVLTPSAGFILDSLGSFGLSDQGRFWTKSKAIAAELLALLTLFVALQSTSVRRMALATLALTALVFLIPLLFRVFAARIAPFAPRSEFAFLLMLALVCAHATRRLGVYYLVGAFLVGVAARQFQEKLPAISSERMLHAVEAFASIFVPFYFFDAGLRLDAAGIGPRAIVLAVVLLLLAIPLRIALVGIHQRLALGAPDRQALRVGVSLLPTLVFSLVLADILRDRFAISEDLYAGLILYALVNTLLPGLFLHTPPPDYDAPHLSGPEWDALAATPRSRPPGEGF